MNVETAPPGVRVRLGLLPKRWIAAILSVLILLQTVLHLGWLSVSAASGQLAVPWLVGQGGVFFDTIIENRPPALPLLLAAVQTVSPWNPILTVRALNLLVVVVITVGVYALASKLVNPLAGLLAAGFWALLQPVYGNILLYFDVVLGALFLAAALLWAWRAPRRPLWVAPLLIGLLLGAATLVKQHAWAVVVLVALWLLITSRRRWPDLAWYSAGVLVLPCGMLLALAAQGTLSSYLFWNWGMNFAEVRPGFELSGDFVRKWLFTVALVPPFALLARSRLDRPAAALIVALWFGSCVAMVPRFGEIYVMAQLPLIAVMSGVVGALLMREAQTTGPAIARQIVMGVAVVLVAAWGFMSAAALVPGPLGRARIPAWDELQPVADWLNAAAEPGDTLFVLPALDGNAQLHPLTELPPPGLWSHGHAWFLAVPEVVDRLLAEWSSGPPSYIVYFPEMAVASEPYIDPLVDFLRGHYTHAETLPGIPFNGDAEIWQLNGS